MITGTWATLRMVCALGIISLPFLCSGAWADEMEQKTRDLVQQIARKMSEQRRTTVAVLDFARVEDGSVNAFGRLLAEELVTKLTDVGGFQVVERRFLDKILQEQKWTQSDLVNPQTAVRFGQLSGVQALITGTIADEGSYLRVNGRLIATETGYVIASAATQLFKDERIGRLWGQTRLATPTPTQPGSGSPPGTPEGPREAPRMLTRVEVQDFSFEARECKASGQRVTCTVSVMNTSQRTRYAKVNVWRASLLVDDLGNQYPPVGAWFGAKGGEGIELPGGIDHQIPPQLPMNLTLKYEGVGPAARYVNMVLDFWETLPFKAVLRNIPLSR